VNKRLKNIIAKYVEQKGVEKSVTNGIDGLEFLIKKIRDSEEVNDTDLTACMFKFAIIEYLYFLPDTEKECIKLSKKFINED